MAGSPEVPVMEGTLAAGMVTLVRRREIWLPTAWGWLLAAAVLAALSLAAVRGLYPFLATSEPAGAEVAVIESWLETDELEEAVAAVRLTNYRIVLNYGGPLQ